MKQIQLTPREYMTNFCKIAKFPFLTKVFHGNVFVMANKEDLRCLGYK